MRRHKILRIGCAAGFSGDRTDSAAAVVKTLLAAGGGVLVFEMLAERTLALAQVERRRNPAAGYSPLMEAMLRPVLVDCVTGGIPIVSNFGAANPRAAAMKIVAMCRELQLANVRVALVEGDDLSDSYGLAILRRYLRGDLGRDVVSANVYVGASSIAEALRAGADIVVTGRVADPSLVVGPTMANFGWTETQWNYLARATMAGHLLECGAQVTGGYFADPGFKDVPDLDKVGFPIAEIASDGSFVITKADNTGGIVDQRTVKEQLLYELHNPAAYLTPDVIADISDATVQEIGPDRVAVEGIKGHPRPASLKALVFVDGGWLGEAEISYAGPNAAARARLAADIVRRRMAGALPMRFDLIGVVSVFGDDAGQSFDVCRSNVSDDVRLRVAGAHQDLDTVERMLREVTALYTCGPAGGGGVRCNISRRLNSSACQVPRQHIQTSFRIVEA